LAKAYFITATDTGIGKTFIAAGLGFAAQSKGLNVGISKPISCGGIEDAVFYKNKLKLKDSIDDINPVKFKQPLSPYAAMKTEKKKVNIARIKRSINNLRKDRDIVLVEGLGGAMAPIKRDYYVADMIKALQMSCVVIARAGLGTINHTLMTIDELKKRKIRIVGIIMNGFDGREISQRSNAQVIEKLSGIKVIGKIKAKSSFADMVKQIQKQRILNTLTPAPLSMKWRGEAERERGGVRK
jgi:dethiobiotin synthetase